MAEPTPLVALPPTCIEQIILQNPSQKCKDRISYKVHTSAPPEAELLAKTPEA
jgi:hypothetical protein